MKPRSPDTEVWAEELQFELLRKAGPVRRLELAGALTSMAWNGARAALDRRYPLETEDRRDERFLSQIYGVKLARKFISCRRHVQGPKNKKMLP